MSRKAGLNSKNNCTIENRSVRNANKNGSQWKAFQNSVDLGSLEDQVVAMHPGQT